ncbi:MAG: hypothetical protein DDT21_02292 [Syntrophomonadaceae bacterium]|nr:hypothetical protein [Bacillota bacterium]
MPTTCPFCQINIPGYDTDPTPCCKYGSMVSDGFSVSDAAKMKIADEVTEHIMSLLDDYTLSIPKKIRKTEVEIPF